MIPTENISLTHEHYDLCVLPRPRSQPCWYLHVEFPSNLGNKMAPPDWLASPPYMMVQSHNMMTALCAEICSQSLFLPATKAIIYPQVESEANLVHCETHQIVGGFGLALQYLLT